MAKWTNRKFRPDYPDEDEFEFLEDGLFSFMADCGAKHAERIVSALNAAEPQTEHAPHNFVASEDCGGLWCALCRFPRQDAIHLAVPVATGDAVDSAAEVRKSALLAAAEHIRSTWGRAYEEDLLGGIFRELPRGQGGVSDEARTRISAMMGRHMAKRIVEELTAMAHLNDEDFTEAFTALDTARNEQSSTVQTQSMADAEQPTLPDEERKRLVAALETARENVKPTVKRLMESESVSNDLLSAAIASTGKEKK